VAKDLTAEVPAASEPLVRPAAPTVTAAERARRTAYPYRFALAYLALALLAGIGIGTTVMLLDRPQEREVAWSSWQPVGRENSYPAQIADYVSPRYRLEGGNQLVGVLGGPAVVQDLPIRAVLIQDESSTPTEPAEIEAVLTGNAVMYTMCGTGENCSIAGGEPNEERGRLLRREALELALYTFKYVEDIDTVIALLPVNLGDAERDDDDTSAALFLQKKDFADALRKPLRETLVAGTLPELTEIDPRESLVVDRLTRPHLFIYDFQPTQDQAAILRLLPVR
jgi:hypothetical protein